MARIRTIKPDFFRHSGLYRAELECGLPIRLAFAGLWTACDREGRFKWSPDELKLDCLPYDDVDFTAVLFALEEHGFVQRYEVDGRAYGLVPSFKEHQVINVREAQSRIPAPVITHKRTVTHVHAHGEGKGREEEGKGIVRGASSDAPALEKPKPTKGTRLADDWKPDEADREYAIARGIDPDLEAENFRDYWLARSGSGAVKLDWSRTWKRWVRTAAKGRGKGKPGPSGTTAPRKGLASAILDVAADFQRRSEQGHGDRGLYGDGLARGYGEGQDDLGGSLEADGDGRIIDGVCEDVAADAAEAGRGNGTGDGVPRAAMPGTGGRGGVRASEVAGAQPVVPDVARTEGYDRHSGGTTAEDARIAILGGARIAQDKRNDVSGPEPPGNTQTRTTDEITGKQANA